MNAKAAKLVRRLAKTMETTPYSLSLVKQAYTKATATDKYKIKGELKAMMRKALAGRYELLVKPSQGGLIVSPQQALQEAAFRK